MVGLMPRSTGDFFTAGTDPSAFSGRARRERHPSDVFVEWISHSRVRSLAGAWLPRRSALAVAAEQCRDLPLAAPGAGCRAVGRGGCTLAGGQGFVRLAEVETIGRHLARR